ncbi:17916_t:CDS:2 [Gigaspora margarita]|uniref:17916_t:CDS:1 n=1 Tax=Gigaspora margarita TaxID=4874 RepID=A0ABN7UCS9_GIGMA|nr:17916_t:CDS:2 [Gigaspora margarita]
MKKSESNAEERLRTNPPVESAPVMPLVNEPPPQIVQQAPEVPHVRPRRRRDPSTVDKLDPYNVAQDILTMKASATIGQLLQYPNQRRNLAQVLKRPLVVELDPDMETNIVQPTNSEHTTAAHCYVRIRNNPVVAVLDSGAAMSLMSRRMMEKLNLKIDEPSTTVVVTANGTREHALGKVNNLKLAIRDIMIPTTFQIIESTDNLLLLDMDWFVKARARLHFAEKRLYLTYGGKTSEFEYEDEILDEAEGYFTEGPPEDELYKNPWKNHRGPAANLANMEVLPVSEPDPEDEPVEVKLDKNIDAAPLSLKKKEKINTGTAVPIKQAPNADALSRLPETFEEPPGPSPEQSPEIASQSMAID